MIKQLFIILIFFINISFAQNFGSLRFTNYADDRQSAFSLTFDDGLLTQSENVRPILNQYGFKGTFYVLPPYLTETLPGIWRYGTWPDFQSMSAEGHEIGSHTMNHDSLIILPWGDVNTQGTLLYELYQSKIFIEQKIPLEKCISLNYPFTLHNSIVDSAANLFYENGRTLDQVPNDSSLSEHEWFGLKAKIVQFSLPRNSVEDDLDELYSFLNWTQGSIDNHKWAMIIIHDVVPFSELGPLLGQIYEPVTSEWLDWLCDWLSIRSTNNEIWIETVGNITRYMKERENSSYQIISSSNQLIEVDVTDDLDNSIYNYPLSAYIKIPEDWNRVRTEQSGIIDTLTAVSTDTGKVVLIKVIPDNGILKISPVTASSVNIEIGNVEEFQLHQNYPNPFNPNTIISWQSPIAGWQTLKIYDVLGNEVATLVNEFKPAGKYEVEFKVGHSADSGSSPDIASGIYFYQLKVGNYLETNKMVLLR